MRVPVTLAAAIVMISLVAISAPASASLVDVAAELLAFNCPDGECHICKDPTSPGALADKIRECLTPP